MSHDELIRAEIDRIAAQNSGDWQSLMRQVDDSYREIRYNSSQMLSILACGYKPTLKELDLEWGRGTGKTTIFAKFTRMISNDLPRGSWQWVVPNYQKFLTEIIPSYIHAMEMQGYYKDLHYFIGKRAPAKWNWPESYKPPLRYDNTIYFFNGFTINLLSQDIPGSGRGLSTDGEFADEVAMLSKKKMDEESGPSIRGSNMRELGKNRWFDFRLKASSTPLTPSGEWFIEREELAMQQSHKHLFVKANCVENIKLNILKPDYLEVAKASTSDIEVFNAEYLNIRCRKVRDGFYGMLSEEEHAYTNFNYTATQYAPDNIGVVPDCSGDGDLVPGQSLILGMDFGASINSLTVCQHLPGEFRCIKDFFVKGSERKTQDDLAEDFCQYYAPHTNKIVLFWHDATGSFATGHTKLSKAEQFEQYLAHRGWTVRRMTVHGTNPRHYEKYRLWELLLSASNARLPRFRINKANAKHTFLSMSRAKSKKGLNNEIKKDKSSERSDNPRRELATDLSDALDNPVFGLFSSFLYSSSGGTLPG
jgi:hypothetical protein